MMGSSENLRVGGEGSYFDSIAADAAAHSRAVASRVDDFRELLRSGVDGAPDPDDRAKVSDYLASPNDEQARLLFEACSLTLAGKYEAGSKVLLDFVHDIARRFGETSRSN